MLPRQISSTTCTKTEICRVRYIQFQGQRTKASDIEEDRYVTDKNLSCRSDVARKPPPKKKNCRLAHQKNSFEFFWLHLRLVHLKMCAGHAEGLSLRSNKHLDHLGGFDTDYERDRENTADTHTHVHTHILRNINIRTLICCRPIYILLLSWIWLYSMEHRHNGHRLPVKRDMTAVYGYMYHVGMYVDGQHGSLISFDSWWSQKAVPRAVRKHSSSSEYTERRHARNYHFSVCYNIHVCVCVCLSTDTFVAALNSRCTI